MNPNKEVQDIIAWLKMRRDGVDNTLLRSLAEAIARGEHIGASCKDGKNHGPWRVGGMANNLIKECERCHHQEKLK